MSLLLNTLDVTTPEAYLRLKGETLCVMVEKEKRLQVPLHHLGSLVCFGDVMLSPALLGRCMSEGRSIVWLDRGGCHMLLALRRNTLGARSSSDATSSHFIGVHSDIVTLPP
jgi:CRISPR/Cas system-associated endonuclease Cas1